MRSVVVVEDDADIRLLVSMILTSHGLEVRDFGAGEPALSACVDSPPDLVLLDWNLPTIQGIDVLRRLRAHPLTAGVPVVMMSAVTCHDRIAQALAAGVDDVLRKPFTRAELVDTLAHHLSCAAA